MTVRRLTPSVRFGCRAAAAVLMLCASAPLASAQEPPDLGRVSLEDLMNVRVTSANRKEQRIGDVAAAVYVISQEDIRRSGLTEVPELLRLAPGVMVARIDANQWAVTIRGFNGRFGNKLLVLVDGRSIYNRIFSGVYWEALDLLVEDIDRIEVVRGSGGSVWGANAVNGIINIITKRADETTGTLVRGHVASLGTREAAMRFGGTLGAAAYRLHLQGAEDGHGLTGDSAAANDNWRTVSTGFRLDWSGGANDVMLSAGGLVSDAGTLFATPAGPVPPDGGWQPTESTMTHRSAHFLARWSHTSPRGVSTTLQAFGDYFRRFELDQRYSATSVDLDAKQERTIAQHDLVWGAGYRMTRDVFNGTYFLSVSPERATLSVFNAFLQDEIRLGGGVHLTAGAKLEHETFMGWRAQPTARVLWAVAPEHRVWGAVSRAYRTPSRLDRGITVNLTSFLGPDGLPMVLRYSGDQAFGAENFDSVEAGYRFEAHQLAISATGFFGAYNRVRSLEPGAPFVELTDGVPAVVVPTQYANLSQSKTHGLELDGRWEIGPRAHIVAAYSFFGIRPTWVAASLDAAQSTLDGSAPEHQWQVRPGIDVNKRIGVDVGILGVSEIHTLAVPSYTRVDAQIRLQLSPACAVAFNFQNLTARHHYEFQGTESGSTASADGRRAGVRVTWSF